MGVDDRHSKPTSAIEADELARLREVRETEGSRDPVSAKPSLVVTTSREAHRPTSKLGKEELVGLLNMADAIVSTKPLGPMPASDTGEPLPPQQPTQEVEGRGDRKTQRMRAKHFQMLVRDGETDTLPLSPDGIEEGVSEANLDVETRARRVAGLPRAQTLEYSSDMLLQLTAESNREMRAEAVKLAEPEPEPEKPEPEAPKIVRTVRRARAVSDVAEEGATNDELAIPVEAKPKLEVIEEPPRPAAATLEVTPEMLEVVARPRPAASTLEVTPEMLEEVGARRAGNSTMEVTPEMLEEIRARPAGSTVEVTPEMLEEVAAKSPVVEPTSAATSELDAIIARRAKTPSPAAETKPEAPPPPEVRADPIVVEDVPKPATRAIPFDHVDLSKLAGDEKTAPPPRRSRRFETEEPVRPERPTSSGAGALAIVSFVIVAAVIALAIYALL